MNLTIFIIANLLGILHLLSVGVAQVPQDLDYTRLEFLGVSCYPNDTCTSGPLPFHNRTCQCDLQCQLYKDCCIDANKIASRPFRRGIQGIVCSAYQSATKGVYMVSMCNRHYRGSTDIRDNCETIEDISDPLSAAPVTDIEFNITYKNRYCAECNFARSQDLRSWSVTVECNDIPDNTSLPLADSTYIQNNLEYVETGEYGNTWGFYHRSQDAPPSESYFYPCTIPFLLPDALIDYVRECVPNVISSCASSWRRNIHRVLCPAYMAIVFTNNRLYRNPDCAYCNEKSLQELKCTIPELTVTGRRKKPALSFTLLLDVNMGSGKRVGEIADERCREGQKWDPFFKKCRRLVCVIPGYRMRNDRCVPP